jgi:pimeloyl-ACP methyl ester carboxylesterase
MPAANGLYYFASDSEDYARPPVVLVHGAGGHHLFWPPQIRRLHNQRIFAVDLSGHGKSEGIGHHTIEAYTAELIELIRTIGLNSAVVVGHSMGGAIALQAAIDFPEHVLGLCLLGSGARLRVAPEILQSTAQETTFAAAVKLITELSFAPQTPTRLKELASARLLEIRPSILHGDLLACDAFDPGGHISAIRLPTLVMCGAEDRMTPPRYSASLSERIAGARLELLPRAGHMLMLERPDDVAEILGHFLLGIDFGPTR